MTSIHTLDKRFASQEQPTYLCRLPFAVCVCALLSVWMVINIHCCSSESFYAVHVDKLARLNSLKSPKLVLIGGSNLSFGIDTPRLERELGLPVANMGLDAGFGLRCMVNAVKPSLKPGDTVLLCIEYAVFQKFLEPNEEFFHLAEVSPSAWLYLDSPTAWVSLGQRFPAYLRIKARLLKLQIQYEREFWKLWGVQQAALPRKNYELENFPESHVITSASEPVQRLPEANGDQVPIVQRRKYYNDAGDLFAHRSFGPYKGAKGRVCTAGGLKKSASVEFLNRFIRECSKKNVKVLCLCPPCPKFFYDRYPQRIDALVADLKQSLNAEMISDYRDYIFPLDCFFNGPNHLNGRGLALRMPRLIGDLERAGCSKPENKIATTQEANGL